MTDREASRDAEQDAAASRPAHEPRARLRAVHPPDLRWTLELGRAEAELGRIAGEGGPPALVHGTVSRRHFGVRWDDGRQRHVGRDLGSHNGSRVDGCDLGPTIAELEDGSVIQLGDVSLVYEEIPAHDSASPPSTDPAIPGGSPAIEALVRAIERAAADASPVLLVGETGTGKRHIARELHRRSGRTGSLVELDCATLDPRHDPPGAFHVPGGSSLFLDRIDALRPPLQARLLQVLRQGEAGGPTATRVVAATCVQLRERVASGGFDHELHARLARFELRVPALRERRGDLMGWLERLHTAWLEHGPEHPVESLALTPEAAELLLLHPWPSNLHDLGRLVHELASDLELPRPIPLEQLPGWILGATPDLPTLPVSGPPAARRSRDARR
jgi:hypothetical protein